MTKENEIKLVSALAARHAGNTKFLKKYNMSCPAADELLEPYEKKDECPPDEILKKANEIFVKEFTEQAVKILEKENCDEFINDLIFKAINN